MEPIARMIHDQAPQLLHTATGRGRTPSPFPSLCGLSWLAILPQGLAGGYLVFARLMTSFNVVLTMRAFCPTGPAFAPRRGKSSPASRGPRR